MSQTSAAFAESQAAESSATPAAEPSRSPIVLETRFGEMSVDPDSTIRMPRGLLGFSALREFALAELPDPKYSGFRVLQSVEDASLSFIVMPYDPARGIIAPDDLTEAFGALGIGAADCLVLLIVSVRRAAAETSVSVNLRAPLMVDVRNRKAWQYVLPNQTYPVRQDLAALSKG